MNLADNPFSHGTLRLDANDIQFNQRLARALPANLQSLYAHITPTGRFSLDQANIDFSTEDDDLSGEINDTPSDLSTEENISFLRAYELPEHLDPAYLGRVSPHQISFSIGTTSVNWFSVALLVLDMFVCVLVCIL